MNAAPALLISIDDIDFVDIEIAIEELMGRVLE